jgi:Fe-Mn family superoxide dismutase
MRDLLTIIEAVETKKLTTEKLPYSKSELNPVMSDATINYHYEKLAKGYAERYNKGEGDADFNFAGNFLHNLFFPQLQAPKAGNKPTDASLKLIEKKFKSFEKFQEDVQTEAMKIQGSGWIYLSTSGSVKTIKNHEVRKDIALLIDWWEHAWALDYQSDKQKYLKNFWRIINWEVINSRL